VQRQNREQTRLDMLKVDPVTGQSSVLFTETARAKSWVNLSSAYRFLKDGSLIWRSERDGFAHLYRFENGAWEQLTRGPWMVTSLDGVDEKAGKLFFTATKDDVLAHQVYALDYTRPAKPERLTELGFMNAASMDGAGQTLVIGRSAQNQPAQTYLADASGKRLAWVEENKVEGAHPYAAFLPAHRAPTFGTIKAADGSDLHWKMITPVMEAGKIYPVFFEHYGGPHSQTVSKGWTGALAQAIVAKGYIYFQIDNRGSANRGVDFEGQISRQSALCRCQENRHLWLVLWRLYDAQDAGGQSGCLCGGHFGCAGDQMGALRHPLYRALSGRSAQGAGGL